MDDDPATLLLVEDDPLVRTFLADNLTADGYELLVADTVRDALRALEYKQPDLAIVDLGLPDGSGLELVRRVRAADGIASRLDPALPLLILSGRSGELDRVRGFERGADDFVGKPFALVVNRSAARPLAAISAVSSSTASGSSSGTRARAPSTSRTTKRANSRRSMKRT